MKVFISGSASINILPTPVVNYISTFTGCEILVGDCYGIDYLVQRLVSKLNLDTTVYYVGDHCRNCWDLTFNTKAVPSTEEGRIFFTAKDKAMCVDCDMAVMVWDGESKGTFRNIEHCKSLCKPYIVFMKDGSLYESTVL